MGKYEKVQKFFYSNRKKVGKVDKDGNEDIITISYKIKIYSSLSCNKNYSDKIDEKLKEQFRNTFKFSNNETSNNKTDKINLLLREGVYPNEHMDEWEKFNETLLPKREDFYSNLNMEDIADSDYYRAKRVCKDF